MFECLLWRYGSVVVCLRTGPLGVGIAYVLLEEVTVDPTMELPELA